MKKVLILVLCGVLSSPFAVAQMQVNEALAFQIAEERHQPVFLVFAGSDWCAPCMRFEKTILSDTTFQSFAKNNLIVLKADFPQRSKLLKEQRAQNERLAERYNPDGLFPYLVLVNPDRSVLSALNYSNQSPAQFIATIRAYLK